MQHASFDVRVTRLIRSILAMLPATEKKPLPSHHFASRQRFPRLTSGHRLAKVTHAYLCVLLARHTLNLEDGELLVENVLAAAEADKDGVRVEPESEGASGRGRRRKKIREEKEKCGEPSERINRPQHQVSLCVE